jgi:tRNA isopentenyl-2-thiomethyl-A-37 hydroxylase MiaE
MDDELKIKMYSFTLDCEDPHELAKFYATLLRWETASFGEDWACAYAPGTKQGAISP